MNTASNVAFLTVATSLVSLGATTISVDLIAGAIEIVLGIACFAIYEKFPDSTKTSESTNNSVDSVSSSTS